MVGYCSSHRETSENIQIYASLTIFIVKSAFFAFALFQFWRTSRNVRLKFPRVFPFLAQCALKGKTNGVLERMKGKKSDLSAVRGKLHNQGHMRSHSFLPSNF